MSFQIALDLIAREYTIGIISTELRMADQELKTVQKGSRELRSSKENRFLTAYSGNFQFVIGHP